MSKFIDYYQLLGVPVDATQREVRMAYLKHAKEQHPDAGGSHETMQLLNKAYETLANQTRRVSYDKIHRQESHSSNAAYMSRDGNVSGGGYTGHYTSDDHIDDFINSVFAEYSMKTPEPSLHKKATKAVRDYLHSKKHKKNHL